MEEKVVSGIILSVFLIGMLTSAFNIQPVRAEPRTWTVDDDGPADFSTIGDAIRSPSVMDGDTIFVYSGTYYEHYLYVYKSLTIIGEDKKTTIIDGGGAGPIIELYKVAGASLSGFTIRNGGWAEWFHFSSGIIFFITKSCSVSETIVLNSRYGISAYRSSGNTISGNTISNIETGIYFESSNNNTVLGNTISNTETGINVYQSHNNAIFDNHISNSTWRDPYWGGGIYLWNSNNNTVADNTISNTTEVGIFHCYSSYNTIVGNVMSQTTEIEMEFSCGIYLGDYSHNNTVLDNDISKSLVGIYLSDWSCSNTITGNTISNLTRYMCGINIWGYNNRIIGNTITNMDYVGIQLNSPSKYPNHCTNNIVGGNVISNSTFGINLIMASFSNTIVGNDVSNNGLGILMGGHGDNNVVIENLVSNTDYGILLFSSNNTKVYHNDFIDNTKQVLLSQSFNTTWDDGYPSGGNYWSDYVGVDADGDGIGDTPYVIDANNQDRYPLMNPWTRAITATVDIDPDALNLKSQGEWITAYIELPEGCNPSEINVSTILLNSTIGADLTAPTSIGDHDLDGIPDLMIKFDRAEVTAYIIEVLNTEGWRFSNATLVVSGKLYNGTSFEGGDIIKLIIADANGDDKVDITDLMLVARALGTDPKYPQGTDWNQWNPRCDVNNDLKVDAFDLLITGRYYGT